MKLRLKAYIHKINIEADSSENNRVTALCCFMTVRPCVHNNFNKYEWILMKLCMQLHINKITDEFNNEANSTVNN